MLQVVHRTIAAVFTSFTSIGILTMLHDRPMMGDIITWIDCEALLLIFSMMVLVAILSDTGFFEYIAIYTYQVGFKLPAAKVLFNAYAHQFSFL